MKKTLFLVFALIASTSFILSQCEAPELISWDYPNDSTLIIGFNASEGTTSYEMEFDIMMIDMDYGSMPQPYYITGTAQAGGNTIILNSTDHFYAFYHNYCSVIINGTCNEESYSSEEFYVSDMSILNEIECSEAHVLNALLPDGVGASYESTFLVEEGDTPLQIDQLSIFIDLTHSYLGDLDVTLTSPSGTTISLMYSPNNFGGASNMSVLFKTGFPELALSILDDGFQTLQGTYSPSQSLAAFTGEILSGTWTITVTDYLAEDWGVLAGACVFVESSPCTASASGSVYVDSNGDGVQDENETPAAYNLLSTSQENSLMTNGQGEFLNCFETGSLDFSLFNIPLYHNVDPENYELELAEGDFLEDMDFRLIPIPGMNDLVVEVYSYIPDVPGFERTYYVSSRNVGTECIEDINLTFTSPENTELLLVNGSADPITSSQEFTLNIGTLCSQESTMTEVELLLDQTLEVGIIHSYQASLNSVETDETPENNTYTLEIQVVSSYDPNDKLVDYEIVYEDFMEEQKRLTYVVRFQNDGTFYAQNVTVTDMIEEGLILESFELLESSHDVIPEFNGRELSLNFNDIVLPQSDLGLEESQGYVRFSFLPNENFSLGETIENTAAIYFDFNEPIITNTAVTLYDEEEIIDSVTELETEDWVVYPNPFSSSLTVESQEKVLSAKLMNVSGQIVLEKQVNSSIFQLETKYLANGIYSLILENPSGVSVSRIVKN